MKIACDCCNAMVFQHQLTIFNGEGYCPICTDLNAVMPQASETAQTIGQDTLLPFEHQHAE